MTSKNLKVFDSRARLLQYLETGSAAPIIIGREAESPRKFYAVTCAELQSPIGLVLTFHGIEPVVKVVGTSGTVLIGHDCTVTGVNVSGNVEFSFPLEGVFFEFIDCEKDRVIVIHELGALKLDSNGNCEWKVHTEIIQHFHIDPPGVLHLELMDADHRIIDTSSGKEINK